MMQEYLSPADMQSVLVHDVSYTRAYAYCRKTGIRKTTTYLVIGLRPVILFGPVSYSGLD